MVYQLGCVCLQIRGNETLAATVQGTASQNVASEHDALLASLGTLLGVQILKVYLRTTDLESWEAGPRNRCFRPSR